MASEGGDGDVEMDMAESSRAPLLEESDDSGWMSDEIDDLEPLPSPILPSSKSQSPFFECFHCYGYCNGNGGGNGYPNVSLSPPSPDPNLWMDTLPRSESLEDGDWTVIWPDGEGKTSPFGSRSDDMMDFSP